MYILVVRKSLSLSKTLYLTDGFRRKRQDLFLIVIIHWHRLSSQRQKDWLLLYYRQISDFAVDNLTNIKQLQLLPMQL